MNAAKLDKSERLQRVLAVLRAGDWLTTREVMFRAHVCAVNSCIAELRHPVNGFDIECRCAARGRHEYRLVREGGFLF